jgi:hypothetical protein
MKRLTILVAGMIFCATASAQSDTTVQGKKSDTMRIGNIIIIKRGKKNGSDSMNITMGRTTRKKSKVSTNWGIVDLGFSNYNDQTDYSTAGSYLVNKPGSPDFSKDDFKVKAGKSINVNVWFFMQTLAVVKHNVNLKYGLGLELNNYRYRSNAALSYKEGGVVPYNNGLVTNAPFIFRDSISFSKNKLAADYLTVPLMINFATNNYSKDKGISVSLGVSAGYLYSQRNKQKSEERGKEKNKGDYNLEKFKLSYIGELGLGPVKLYASYSPKSMYENGLDIRPFNFGFRLSN